MAHTAKFYVVAHRLEQDEQLSIGNRTFMKDVVFAVCTNTKEDAREIANKYKTNSFDTKVTQRESAIQRYLNIGYLEQEDRTAAKNALADWFRSEHAFTGKADNAVMPDNENKWCLHMVFYLSNVAIVSPVTRVFDVEGLRESLIELRQREGAI